MLQGICLCFSPLTFLIHPPLAHRRFWIDLAIFVDDNVRRDQRIGGGARERRIVRRSEIHARHTWTHDVGVGAGFG